MKDLSLGLVTLILYIFIQAVPTEGLLVALDLKPFVADQLAEIGKNSLVVVFAMFLFKKLGLSQTARLNRRALEKGWYILLFPTYLIFIGLLGIKDLRLAEVPIPQITLLLISTLSIGFSEEIVFRGLIQMLLIRGIPKKKW